MQVTSGMPIDGRLDTGSSLSENCPVGSDSNMSVRSGNMQGSQSKLVSASTQKADMKVQYPGDADSLNQDCSTSKTHRLEENKAMQRNRSSGIGERGKHKRWRGRNDNLQTLSEVLVGCYKPELSATTSAGFANANAKKSPVLHDSSNKLDKHEVVLGLKELATKGMIVEVEEISALDPNFCTHNPVLLFQLKQVEFYILVRAGYCSSALKVASSHLGLLPAKDPTLLKPLKETLLALLTPTEEPIGKRYPLDALASSVRTNCNLD